MKDAVALNEPRKEQALTIEGKSIDWLSAKTQTAWALLICLIVSLLCFWQTTSIGFLLDDLLHFDYVTRAMRGDWHDFLANFYSNWGGSDLMLSYRPLTSLTFFTDHLIWGVNAFGYHLTNLLLLFGCVCFVSFITLELTGAYGNQLKGAGAVWAGLLFLVYPLHVESVAWIVGRVDLLSTLFYLASVFTFMRFRLTRDSFYLSLSLVAFLAALLSKEMAVTLPVVLTIYTLFFPGQRRHDDLKLLALYFGALACFAVIRTLILGATVGGYGTGGLSSVLASGRNFADLESIIKILVPVNEELAPVRAYSRFLLPVYIVILALSGYRAIKSPHLVKVLVFLLCWAGIALLPTFQVWKIYPNLVGSRLFFLSSAPLAILIAIAALPVVDILSVRQARVAAIVGTGCLIWTCSIYATLTELNLKPWVEAGRRMTAVRGQLQELAKGGEKIVLIDLPTDYQGAGLITRPSYLRIMLSPPLAVGNLFERVETLTGDSAQKQDQIDLKKLRALAQEGSHRLFSWNEEEGIFKPWSESGGGDSYLFDAAKNASAIETAPAALKTNSQNWRVFSSTAPTLEKHDRFVRIYPGIKGPLRLLFPATDLNPTRVASFELELTLNTDGSTEAPVPQLFFQSKNGSGCFPLKARNGVYTAEVGSFKNWVLSARVCRIGLELPRGTYSADLKRILAKVRL